MSILVSQKQRLLACLLLAASSVFMSVTSYGYERAMINVQTIEQTYDFTNAANDNLWVITNDSVMGGRSNGRVVIHPTHVEFSGYISLESNGGFSSVYHPTAPLGVGIAKVTVEVEGDGKTYQFRAITNYRGYRLAYKHEFKTRKGVKETITLHFDDFVASYRGRALPELGPLAAESIYALGFLLNNKKAGPFMLKVHRVTFEPAQVQTWIPNMNKVSPKSLLHSKWTKVEITNKEKHFVITEVEFDDNNKVIHCVIEAVMSKNEYAISWRDLKDSKQWRIGWQ